MPLLKVHICSSEAPANKALLVKILQKTMIEKLQTVENTNQVILYETQPQHRLIQNIRSNNFVFLEVLMAVGMPLEIKRELVKGLVEAVNKVLKVDLQDINCCLVETQQDNWFAHNP
jgi:phenylpyruvate tautomerase PptA (4-oxalocrotonate tautomerase family)